MASRRVDAERRRWWWDVLLWAGGPLAICIGVALVAVDQWGTSHTGLRSAQSPSGSSSLRLATFRISSAAQLARVLELAWAHISDPSKVPAGAPERLPPNMEQLRGERRKETFFRAVLPHILAENSAIRRQRAELLELQAAVAAGRPPSPQEAVWLATLAVRYRVPDEVARRSTDGGALLEDLLLRVDEIPPGLALAQAAVESAWGTSRFAKLGSSLFGQWVFDADAGMAPRDRPQGANYAVAQFRGLRGSVQAYFRNLNGFWAYEEFRRMRAAARASEDALDSVVLAGGLELYSVQREQYVNKLRRVIRANQLQRFDRCRLVAVEHGFWDRIMEQLQPVGEEQEAPTGKG